MQKNDKLERRPRRRVLIVDDEIIDRQLLKAIVSRKYEVLCAESGEEALETIRSQPLSLVLLDLIMPGMNGYEVLRAIRKDPALRQLPVIVLTAEKGAEVETLRLGATDFIPKPFYMPEVILARIDRSIELAEDKLIISGAETDPLTGLYKQDFFLHYARQLDRFEPDLPMDAVVLNINRFHLVNELYGRAFGDSLLREIGSILRRLVQGTPGLAGRTASDTFVLYLPHREDYEASLLAPLAAAGGAPGRARATVRVGIYPLAAKSADLEQRLDRANLACSRLRGNYATACAYYDTSTHEEELQEERLISGMETALQERQFRVFYQPKYLIQGNRPVLASAEALIRWVHPERGMIPPASFIPLFEQNGLISRLDHYVWREVAEQIRAWKDRYGFSVPISVNVSRVDLFDPGLEDTLREVLDACGLEPSEYLLEITESSYTDHAEQLVETVHRLRALGFQVEMDDFGTGYSSLNMLTALPIDTLKLDMGFIRNIASSPKELRMVELMLDLAKFLAVPVVAEGVETEEQYRLLKNAGCELIQGYYFSRPVPPEEFALLIEKELKERESDAQNGADQTGRNESC